MQFIDIIYILYYYILYFIIFYYNTLYYIIYIILYYIIYYIILYSLSHCEKSYRRTDGRPACVGRRSTNCTLPESREPQSAEPGPMSEKNQQIVHHRGGKGDTPHTRLYYIILYYIILYVYII